MGFRVYYAGFSFVAFHESFFDGLSLSAIVTSFFFKVLGTLSYSVLL